MQCLNKGQGLRVTCAPESFREAERLGLLLDPQVGFRGFRVFKVHMEKKVENEIETGMIWV